MIKVKPAPALIMKISNTVIKQVAAFIQALREFPPKKLLISAILVIRSRYSPIENCLNLPRWDKQMDSNTLFESSLS